MAILREDLRGRTVLYTDAVVVDSSNVGDVLQAAINDHETNQNDIEYLYEYYKGDTPINTRTKDFNGNINNKICINRASEIVNFKVGYLLSAPIQYIDAANNDAEDDILSNDLDKLIQYCKLEDKDTSDLEVAEWQSICGTAYRMVLPKDAFEEGESPFSIHTLDPRYTAVVYSSRLGHKPMMAFTSVEQVEENRTIYYVYTDTDFYVLDGEGNDASDELTKSGPHALGRVPIIEYPANNARMGDFEGVITVLNAINTVTSNQVDGVEQFIQAILCMENLQIEAKAGQSQEDAEIEFLQAVRETGGLMLPKDSRAYYLLQELNQTQTETLIEELYDSVLSICGMPSRHYSSRSTSDTGSAVMLRDGWSTTEAYARNRENYYKKSERKFLNIMISLCNNIAGTNLMYSAVDIRFPRRNYTNDSANVTNLISMLSSDWITPEFAYSHSNMCADPHHEYLLAKKWHEQAEKDDVDALAAVNDDEPEDSVVESVVQRDETSTIMA